MSNELKLMVGDWVLKNDIETKVTVDLLMILELNKDKWYNIKPITLTPEIMDRIEGIEHIKEEDKYCITLAHVEFGLLNNSLYTQIQSGLFIFSFNSYLHQLQQLIRLFTNKEIELKWEK